MVVYPKIIVKTFDGDQAELEQRIGVGGVEEINKGELVLWRGPEYNRLYTKDRFNNLVMVGKRDTPAYTSVVEMRSDVYVRTDLVLE